MSELKTLKDCYMSDGRNFEQKLKEEAIMWIKSIYCFTETEIDKFYYEYLGRETIYSEEGKQAIINFIKHFFNITEEDLK